MAMTIETLKIELSADIEDLKRQLKDTQNALDSMNKKAKASQDSLSMLTTALMAKFAYSAIREFVSIGKSAYSMAQDVTESESLFTTSMGRMGAAAREWSENLSQTLGLNAYTLRSQVGTIYNMTRSMGIAEQTAYDLSTGVVELANDMASFYNMSTDEAFSKLSSGLTGEAEPLKRIGILVDENTIKTYAYKNGIAAAGAELTQQQKVLARYYAILGQTGNAQGDLARTIDSPANQMRIMQAQFEQAKIELGYGLIPIIKEVLPYLTALAQGFIEVAQSVFGVRSVLSEGNSAASVYSSQLDSAAESEKTLGTEAEKAGKKIKGTIAGLDELNKLGSGSSGTSDSLLSSDELSFNLPSLDSTESLGSVFDTEELAEAKEVIDAIFTTVGNLKGLLIGVAGLTLATKIGTWTTSLQSLSLAGSLTSKAFIGAGSLAMAFDSSISVGEEMAKATPNWGKAISSMVTGGIGTVVGGMMIGGPVGALAGGLIALTGVMVGFESEQTKLRLEMLRTDYYDVQGQKIQDVQAALREYFNALDIDEQQMWINTIKDSETAYNDAQKAYDELWFDIANKGRFETDDIDALSEAFNTLVGAAKSLSNARIDALMESISDGIRNNITPELNGQLSSLLGQLEKAKILINNEYSKVSAEYQMVLDEISNLGENEEVPQHLLDKLNNLRQEVTAYTPPTNYSAELYKVQTEKAIKAGASKEEVLGNVKSLMTDRDTYIDTIDSAEAESRATLSWLENLDTTKFGGRLGFADAHDANIKAITDHYGKLRAEAYKTYNDTLSSIINTYENSTVMKSGQSYEQIYDSGFAEWLAMDVGGFVAGLFGGDDYVARSELAREQTALLEELKKYYISGYATGGFPEDGLFYANHNELVGKFTNGKTAVANNEQIVEGIKRGVTEALFEAGGTGDGGNWIIQIVDENGHVKAETIISAAERRNRRDGKTVINVGT